MASRAENVGIKAMEIYFPSRYVPQPELETYLGASTGKFTIGLGQTNMSFCDDREDLYSLALTTVSSLLRKYNIDTRSIGRLEVGTETILDKAKSCKSVLMQLFSDNPDIEGIDTYNACYGGTSALLNAVNWIESSSWDGRDAIVVAGDISIYDTPAARPTGGAGCIAMLIGPNAPLVVEPVRASFMRHVYDFYKADFKSEYPLVNGHFSNKCYTEALDGCYQRYKQKVQDKKKDVDVGIDMFDFFIFHAPNCKLVAKSYARLLFDDYLDQPEGFDSVPGEYLAMDVESTLSDKRIEKVFMGLAEERFALRVKPSLTVPSHCGNMYTASVWAGLVSLVSNVASDQLLSKRIGVYSYGGGLASTLLTLRVRGDTSLIAQKIDLYSRLRGRMSVNPEVYNEAYGRKDFTPKGSVDALASGTYYLVQVDGQFQRKYDIKA
ncbi:hypothetical protein EYZ11_007641 [Aspergillus tanneri]|uniref:Hydroxymethylglutaryl-CoA synthase n=1 Tax=Aspergillus tanneri TaxID=1220188 RepID=A0A4S3JCH8_9EURO|nr:hypothetical protein EYZ11_007641 [Aspergillus tanneri]